MLFNSITYFGGLLLAVLWRDVLRIRVNTVLQNLRIAYKKELSEDEIKECMKKNFHHYGMLFFETLLLPFLSAKQIQNRVTINQDALDRLSKMKNEGKGAFFLVAHMGNWEILSHFGGYYGFELSIVTKTFKMKWLHKLWFFLRRHKNISYVDVEGTAMHLLKQAKHGRFIAMMLDQHMQPPVGVESRFFNEKVGTIRSLAMLAARAQLPVIPVWIERLRPGNYAIHIESALEPSTVRDADRIIIEETQKYTNIIESWVRKVPHQWMWLHRRFKYSHVYQ